MAGGGGGLVVVEWRREVGGQTWGENRAAPPAHREYRSLPKMNGGLRRRGGRVLRVILFIVFICRPPPTPHLIVSPWGLCGSLEKEEGAAEADTVLSGWARLAQPGQGPGQRA